MRVLDLHARAHVSFQPHPGEDWTELAKHSGWSRGSFLGTESVQEQTIM
jgi:hypothetical protein